MKKIFKSAGLFGTWLAIFAVCAGLIMSGIGNVGFLSSIIMSTFVLMPLRDWVASFIVWGIQYLFSINPTIKKTFSPYLVVDNLDPTGDKKVLDKGVLRMIRSCIWAIAAIVACFFLAFQSVSGNIVYSFLYKLSVFFGYFAESKGYIPFIWVIVTIAGWIGLFIIIRSIVKGKFGLPYMIALPVIIIGKKIYNWVIFQYNWPMIGKDLLFWGVLILIIGLPIGIFTLVKSGSFHLPMPRRRRRRRRRPDDDDDEDDFF